MTAFTAISFGKVNRLAWRTATETGNRGFEIHRSGNGSAWEILGFAAGKFTTQVAQAYSFTDDHPLPGIHYYRLRQVNEDGSHEFSKVVSATLAATATGIAIYPNPSSGVFELAVQAGSVERLRIFDREGRLVGEQVGMENGQADLSGQPNGIYFLELKFGAQVVRQRVVKN